MVNGGVLGPLGDGWPAKGEICKVWRLAAAQLQATGEISRNQDVLGALQFEDEGSEPTEKTQFFVVLI